MSEKDNLDWLDELAGRKTNAPSEARELRPDVLARLAEAREDSQAAIPAQGAGRDAELIAPARAEGPFIDESELQDNPFARRSSLRATLRSAGSRGWAAAALAIGVIALGWHLRPMAPEEVYRDSPDGVVRLHSADPRALRKQIVDELRAVGVEAAGYEQLGIDGIDANLPPPVSDDVRRALEKHHIPVPKDGVLRVEIAAPAVR